MSADATPGSPRLGLLPGPDYTGAFTAPATMRIEHIRQRLADLGAKPVHIQRVLRLWAQALPQDGGKRRPEDFLPQAVREGLDLSLIHI